MKVLQFMGYMPMDVQMYAPVTLVESRNQYHVYEGKFGRKLSKFKR
jgi:hypothetical protein